MESRNAPLVRQLFALLQEVLAIASALQDNDDPIAPNINVMLTWYINRIHQQIDIAAGQHLHGLVRGGPCRYDTEDSRSACRTRCEPDDFGDDIGFRVVCLSQGNHTLQLKEQADVAPLRRLLRGGSWFAHPRGCCSAFRKHIRSGFASVTVGFRVVCRDPAGHTIQLEEQADG